MIPHRHADDADCPYCESIAEDRAERAATEYEIRVRENRYERGLWADR